MIKSITIKNCATYPATGATIENCQKVNFFYGPNGSGKSTIGKFLKNPTDPQYKECSIVWQNHPPITIDVYNREFREKNIKGDIDGVFTLGQATIEEKQELEKLKAERIKKRTEAERLRQALQKKLDEEKDLIANFRDLIWETIYKANEADFQDAFSGFRNSKDRFRDEAVRRYKISHSSSETREKLLSRVKSLFSQKPEKCASIVFDIDNIAKQIFAIENAGVWGKVIVGNQDVPIGKLIEKLNMADWVNHGRQYLGEDGICPFCQNKTISADLRNQLDEFFSGEYEQYVDLIKKLLAEYITYADKLLSSIKTLITSLDSYPAAGIDIDKLNSIIGLLSGYFSKNIADMQIKEKEPGRTIALMQTSGPITSIVKLVYEGNLAISEHNKMVANYTAERDKLIADIWSYILANNVPIFAQHFNELDNVIKAINGLQKSLNNGNQLITDLSNKIAEADKNITSVQPAVDEINRLLKSYGFTNFQIVPSPDHSNAYQIQRMDGTLVNNTLSEGEETFISFLYFLQFAKGSVDVANVSSRKILVFDDPISSLDSTVLYIVSSLVKGLIKEVRDGKSNVEQIFLLTHNVFFHKETAFIGNRSEICNDIHYWTINKDNNVSTIKAYEKDNPIKSSYELLWDEIRNNADASLITIQNCMRRILENYFNILGKSMDSEIEDKFPTIEDKTVCRSLFSWINDGSHTIPDDLYFTSSSDSTEHYKRVFKDIFIHMGHEAHYKMMMKE
jgi:wobble nucleotide-excising tRNase